LVSPFDLSISGLRYRPKPVFHGQITRIGRTIFEQEWSSANFDASLNQTSCIMKKLLFIAFLLYLNPVFGQTRGPIKDKNYRQAIQQAERFVDSLRTRQDIPGISVSVGTSEEILWAEGFGYADLEAHLPVTIATKFRMGSVSKSITSLAVGKLVEEGKLDLDAPVQQYVPGFPTKKYPFTSRQLATHTAGIRHYGSNDPLACPKRYASVQEGLIIFSQDSLLFKPGTAYNYSTYGYSLLSAVIESASHTDYLSYMQTAVFSPLNMTDTGADYSDSIVTNRVRFLRTSGQKTGQCRAGRQQL
jgi:serine beta-lactamase-like protein LACTB